MEHKESKLLGLDIIRCILMIMVFMSHSLGYLKFGCRTFVKQIFEIYHGGVAVTCFFVLSGFCSAYNFNRGRYNESFIKAYQGYVVRKIKKLYPPYSMFFAVSVLLTVSGFIPLRCTSGGGILNSRIFWEHLLLVQSLNPSYDSIMAFTSTGWFLSSLLIVYLIAPYIIYGIETVSIKYRYGLYFSEIIVFVIFVLSAGIVYKWYESRTYLLYMSPVFRVVEFSVGVIAGGFRKKRKIPAYVEIKQILAFVIFLMGLFFIHNIQNIGLRQMIAAAVPAVILIYYFSFNVSEVVMAVDKEVVHKLADKGLGVFLSHYMLLEAVKGISFNTEENVWWLLICVFAVSVVMASGRNLLSKRNVKS